MALTKATKSIHRFRGYMGKKSGIAGRTPLADNGGGWMRPYTRPYARTKVRTKEGGNNMAFDRPDRAPETADSYALTAGPTRGEGRAATGPQRRLLHGGGGRVSTSGRRPRPVRARCSHGGRPIRRCR